MLRSALELHGAQILHPIAQTLLTNESFELRWLASDDTPVRNGSFESSLTNEWRVAGDPRFIFNFSSSPFHGSAVSFSGRQFLSFAWFGPATNQIRQRVTLPADASLLELTWMQYGMQGVGNQATPGDALNVKIVAEDDTLLESMILDAKDITPGKWQASPAMNLTSARGQTVDLVLEISRTSPEMIRGFAVGLDLVHLAAVTNNPTEYHVYSGPQTNLSDLTITRTTTNRLILSGIVPGQDVYCRVDTVSAGATNQGQFSRFTSPKLQPPYRYVLSRPTAGIPVGRQQTLDVTIQDRFGRGAVNLSGSAELYFNHLSQLEVRRARFSDLALTVSDATVAERNRGPGDIAFWTIAWYTNGLATPIRTETFAADGILSLGSRPADGIGGSLVRPGIGIALLDHRYRLMDLIEGTGFQPLPIEIPGTIPRLQWRASRLTEPNQLPPTEITFVEANHPAVVTFTNGVWSGPVTFHSSLQQADLFFLGTNLPQGSIRIPLSLPSLTEGRIVLAQGLREGQGTVADGGSLILDSSLPADAFVELSADPIRLKVQTPLRIPAGTREIRFDLEVVDNRRIDGPQDGLVRVIRPESAGLRISAGRTRIADDDYPEIRMSMGSSPDPRSYGSIFLRIDPSVDSPIVAHLDFLHSNQFPRQRFILEPGRTWQPVVIDGRPGSPGILPDVQNEIVRLHVEGWPVAELSEEFSFLSYPDFIESPYPYAAKEGQPVSLELRSRGWNRPKLEGIIRIRDARAFGFPEEIPFDTKNTEYLNIPTNANALGLTNLVASFELPGIDPVVKTYTIRPRQVTFSTNDKVVITLPDLGPRFVGDKYKASVALLDQEGQPRDAEVAMKVGLEQDPTHTQDIQIRRSSSTPTFQLARWTSQERIFAELPDGRRFFSEPFVIRPFADIRRVSQNVADFSLDTAKLEVWVLTHDGKILKAPLDGDRIAAELAVVPQGGSPQRILHIPGTDEIVVGTINPVRIWRFDPKAGTWTATDPFPGKPEGVLGNGFQLVRCGADHSAVAVATEEEPGFQIVDRLGVIRVDSGRARILAGDLSDGSVIAFGVGSTTAMRVRARPDRGYDTNRIPGFSLQLGGKAKTHRNKILLGNRVYDLDTGQSRSFFSGEYPPPMFWDESGQWFGFTSLTVASTERPNEQFQMEFPDLGSSVLDMEKVGDQMIVLLNEGLYVQDVSYLKEYSFSNRLVPKLTLDFFENRAGKTNMMETRLTVTCEGRDPRPLPPTTFTITTPDFFRLLPEPRRDSLGRPWVYLKQMSPGESQTFIWQSPVTVGGKYTATARQTGGDERQGTGNFVREELELTDFSRNQSVRHFNLGIRRMGTAVQMAPEPSRYLYFIDENPGPDFRNDHALVQFEPASGRSKAVLRLPNTFLLPVAVPDDDSHVYMLDRENQIIRRYTVKEFGVLEPADPHIIPIGVPSSQATRLYGLNGDDQIALQIHIGNAWRWTFFQRGRPRESLDLPIDFSGFGLVRGDRILVLGQDESAEIPVDNPSQVVRRKMPRSMNAWGSYWTGDFLIRSSGYVIEMATLQEFRGKVMNSVAYDRASHRIFNATFGGALALDGDSLLPIQSLPGLDVSSRFGGDARFVGGRWLCVRANGELAVFDIGSRTPAESPMKVSLDLLGTAPSTGAFSNVWIECRMTNTTAVVIREARVAFTVRGPCRAEVDGIQDRSGILYLPPIGPGSVWTKTIRCPVSGPEECRVHVTLGIGTISHAQVSFQPQPTEHSLRLEEKPIGGAGSASVIDGSLVQISQTNLTITDLRTLGIEQFELPRDSKPFVPRLISRDRSVAYGTADEQWVRIGLKEPSGSRLLFDPALLPGWVVELEELRDGIHELALRRQYQQREEIAVLRRDGTFIHLDLNGPIRAGMALHPDGLRLFTVAQLQSGSDILVSEWDIGTLDLISQVATKAPADFHFATIECTGRFLRTPEWIYEIGQKRWRGFARRGAIHDRTATYLDILQNPDPLEADHIAIRDVYTHLVLRTQPGYRTKEVGFVQYLRDDWFFGAFGASGLKLLTTQIPPVEIRPNLGSVDVQVKFRRIQDEPSGIRGYYTVSLGNRDRSQTKGVSLGFRPGGALEVVSTDSSSGSATLTNGCIHWQPRVLSPGEVASILVVVRGDTADLRQVAVMLTDGDVYLRPRVPVVSETTVPADRDQDGLPDDWEIRNGFDPRETWPETGDLDGDSITDRMEYVLGLDPFVVQVTPRITASATGNGDLALSFRLPSGMNAALEESRGLTGEWLPAGGRFPGVAPRYAGGREWNIAIPAGAFDGTTFFRLQVVR